MKGIDGFGMVGGVLLVALIILASSGAEMLIAWLW